MPFEDTFGALHAIEIPIKHQFGEAGDYGNR
jgi:hypothetical protein